MLCQDNSDMANTYVFIGESLSALFTNQATSEQRHIFTNQATSEQNHIISDISSAECVSGPMITNPIHVVKKKTRTLVAHSDTCMIFGGCAGGSMTWAISTIITKSNKAVVRIQTVVTKKEQRFPKIFLLNPRALHYINSLFRYTKKSGL